MNQDKLVPILAGGAFIGITSAFPFINLLNLCCCLLIINGGVLTSYLYIRRVHGAPVSMGDGALLGLLAGLVGALVEAVMSIPLQLISASTFDTAELVEILQQNPDVPPEVAEALATVLAGGVGGGLFIVGLLVSLVITGAFSAGGGVLGVAIFRKPAPPPQAPPVTTYVPPSGPASPPAPPAPPSPTAQTGPSPGSPGSTEDEGDSGQG